MSNLISWNEAFDFGRAQLGMTEAEAEAYANEHFVNPDAIVEELHAQPLDDEAITQREHQARRARAEGWPREESAAAEVGLLPGYLDDDATRHNDRLARIHAETEAAVAEGANDYELAARLAALEREGETQ